MTQADPHTKLMDYYQNPHIVLMSSDDIQTAELCEYLVRQGFRQITVTTTVAETETLIYDAHPDMLILDVATPDYALFELCQQIKHDRENLGYLPIALLTNMQEDNWRLVGMLAADVYLFKPIQLWELLVQVMALMWFKREFDYLHHENEALEDNLKNAQDMALKVKLIQRHFTRNVNHEFRTPLLQVKSSIAMLTKLLKEQVDIPKAHTLAEMATQATARLENVFRNVAQFDIFDDTTPAPTDIKAVIKSAIHHFKRIWVYQSDVARIEDFLEVNAPLVMGNQRALKEMLIKLIENALKFSPPDSKVQISLRIEPGQDRVWVGIRDAGIGIAASDYNNIFEPFVQLDPSTTREHNGLGIGLTIAQMLADGMGTHIYVESKEGQGTLFWFTLPIAKLRGESDGYAPA